MHFCVCKSSASVCAFSCLLMALCSSLSAVLVPASVCSDKQTATKNIDENSLGKQYGLQFIMRYSNSGEQNLETSLTLEIVHQLFLTKRHTPLTFPRSCRSVLTMHGKNRHVYCLCLCSATTQRNIGYYSYSGPVDMIDSNRAHPVCTPVIVCLPIERRADAVYSLGDPHQGARKSAWFTPPPLSPLNLWDYGQVRCK